MSNTAVAGFDISAVVSPTALSVWVPFMDGCRVKVRYVPRDQLREVSRKATTTTFDKKTHQKIEEVDRDKWDEELGAVAVEDWDGFVNGKEPFPCTPANVKTFMTKWSVFSKFIGDICVDLETLAAAGKEAERKNSETGSSPEGATHPSAAKTAEKLKPSTE